jgi:hypothetical protein
MHRDDSLLVPEQPCRAAYASLAPAQAPSRISTRLWSVVQPLCHLLKLKVTLTAMKLPKPQQAQSTRQAAPNPNTQSGMYV